ncbi:MAG: hypothetical protein ISR65_03475 [Bacteriovoracaceae bacterium]|nr:hypothetical protein [Bacteriovoracaceae bacterium]
MIDPKQRRQILLDNMAKIKADGINCQNCQSVCCTYVANSIRVTPIEAFDLVKFLTGNQLLGAELIGKIQESIKHNRLEHTLSNGPKALIRKTYNCPFVTKGPKGCMIAPESKPYGCLAFNALEANANGDDGKCKSDIPLLEKREELFASSESIINDHLKQEFGLDWDKETIPVAIMSVLN